LIHICYISSIPSFASHDSIRKMIHLSLPFVRLSNLAMVHSNDQHEINKTNHFFINKLYFHKFNFISFSSQLQQILQQKFHRKMSLLFDHTLINYFDLMNRENAEAYISTQREREREIVLVSVCYLLVLVQEWLNLHFLDY